MCRVLERINVLASTPENVFAVGSNSFIGDARHITEGVLDTLLGVTDASNDLWPGHALKSALGGAGWGCNTLFKLRFLH